MVPNPNVVRVAPGKGYHRAEGNRPVSRNGRVSDPPAEIPYILQFATSFIAVRLEQDKGAF